MLFGNTTALSMSGASPGGVAVLVVPEHDLVFAAFGNDPRAMALHDQLILWLLRDHLKVHIPAVVSDPAAVTDLSPYAGTYRSNQLRVDVSVVDGQLEEKVTYEPLDEMQARSSAGSPAGRSQPHRVASYRCPNAAHRSGRPIQEPRSRGTRASRRRAKANRNCCRRPKPSSSGVTERRDKTPISTLPGRCTRSQSCYTDEQLELIVDFCAVRRSEHPK
jgi:hypothetical protein